MDCPRGFTNLAEVTNNVGDETKECDTCPNMRYSCGILTCKHVLDALGANVRNEYKEMKRGK